MNPSREEMLFQAALAQPNAGRSAWLERECAGDEPLRQRVEALLAAHEQTDSLLATDADIDRPNLQTSLSQSSAEALGQTIGRYQLLEKLGEGGCGVVYVAEQTEPVRRRVALKVIKPGMDSKTVIARFEAERQALALMDHPNIAKVLDAGTADSGRPYFVMELVRGIPITDYCDQNQLSTRERLDLFIKVCHAIQHAHQKGIIHRDLKPSNILVTLHDVAPVPKVIDFGIAKATEGRLTDATVYTQLHQFLGTPAYMSPEQAGMSGLDLDTRSDIYSLGVLLYELLTGTTPFDGKELLASGLDELRRIIRETEPVKPSTRLTQSQKTGLHPPGFPQSAIANRQSPIPSDLDWIVMKCLEKDRNRRYETANGLAADLQRHLTNEPVIARPPSVRYRFQKAFHRNKLAFTAGLAVALALMVGFGISIWQWRNAEAARRVAEHRANAEAAARREQIRERENAQQAHARTAELLSQLEIQKAGELFLANKPSVGLAHLAWVLREHPTNRVVVDRLLSALIQYSFARPKMDLTGHRVLGFSPDGQRFVTISGVLVQLWDTASGQPAAPPFTHEAVVSRVEFSPDGRWILTESLTTSHGAPRRSYRLQAWDLDSGRPVGEFISIASEGPRHTAPPAARFSPGGQSLIVTYASAIRVLEARRGPHLLQPMLTIINGGPFTSARFSLDERRILTTTQDGVRIWDALTGQLERTYSDDTEHTTPIRGATLSPDANRWMTFSSSSHTVYTWDIASGRLLAAVSPGAALIRAEFSPDGQRILTVTTDWSVRIWDSRTGQPIGKSIKHEAPVTSARFSPNGQWVLTSSGGGIARVSHVWDSFTGQPLIDGFRPSELYPYFSPDGRFIAVQFDDTFRLWELSMAPIVFDRGGTHGTSGRIFGISSLIGTNSRAFSGPPPSWFPEMVEAVAGQRFTEKRTLEPLGFAERLKFQSRIVEGSEDDPYVRIARWLFADRDRRTISPFSTTTIEEYVQEKVRQDSLNSLRDALRLSPDNRRAMSQLAVHLAAQDPLDNPRRTGEAEYFSRRGLELLANDPQAWWRRVEVLAAIDRLPEALHVNETAIQRFSEHPELWNQRGNLLERMTRWDEADQAYSRAIASIQQESGESAERHGHYLLNRSDAQARQGLSSEAQADRSAGLKLLQALRREDSSQWSASDLSGNRHASASGLPESFAFDSYDPDWGDPDGLVPRAIQGVRFILPLGSSSLESPTVATGKIFVGTNNQRPRDPRHRGDRSILMCFDAHSQAFLWQLVIPKLASGKVNDWEQMGLLSTPAVEGNRIYLVTTRCEVLCLTTDGLAKGNVGPFREEGRYAAGPGKPEIEPGPKDADIVWRYDMMEELGVFPHNGSRTHVLIVGDLLYVGTCNGVDWTHVNIPSPLSPSLIALNKNTGELVGEDDAGIGPRIFHGQWCSPSTGRVGDRQLVIYGGGDGFCYAFDAVPVPGEDGPVLRKVWWADCNPPEYRINNGRPIRYPHGNGPSEIVATPVFWKNRVYVAIGQEPEHGDGVGNLVCLDATGEGDISKTGILWSYREIRRSMSTAAITPDGLLFIADFSGLVHCVDAETGRPYWVHDMKAHIWGSTLVADGKVYVGDEDGDFVVLAASKEKKVLSSIRRDGEVVDGPNVGAPIYSTPVVANGVVYFNSASHLFALEDPFGDTVDLPRDSTSSRP